MMNFSPAEIETIETENVRPVEAVPTGCYGTDCFFTL